MTGKITNLYVLIDGTRSTPKAISAVRAEYYSPKVALTAVAIPEGHEVREIKAEACFERVDFSGLDLRGADFRCANLQSADFTGADLRGADFFDADLRQATLKEAKTTGLTRGESAKFERAKIELALIDPAMASPVIGDLPVLSGAIGLPCADNLDVNQVLPLLIDELRRARRLIEELRRAKNDHEELDR
jgi:hypothetical protein